MKEAVGELNTTVIVVLSIGILSAFFFMYIWPMISDNFESTSKCQDAVCEKCRGDNCEFVECWTKENPDNRFNCSYKG